MSSDRPLLPTRDQIDAIADLGTIEYILQDVIAAKLEIETQLEFSSRDEDWESRAIKALTAHRITEHNLRRRIARLTGKSQAQDDSKAVAKAQARETQAQVEAAAAHRKAKHVEEMKFATLQAIKKMLEKGSYQAHFQRVAHDLVPPELLDRIHAEAQRLQHAAITEVAAAAHG